MIHGATLFAALGAYLGWRKGKAGAGAIGGLLSGTIAALSFYALAPIGGYSMMLVSWLLLWIMLAALQTYLDGRLNIAKAIGRGIDHRRSSRRSASASSCSSSIAAGRRPTFSFFKHFVAWSMAYLPGLYVLLKR